MYLDQFHSLTEHAIHIYIFLRTENIISLSCIRCNNIICIDTITYIFEIFIHNIFGITYKMGMTYIVGITNILEITYIASYLYEYA